MWILLVGTVFHALTCLTCRIGIRIRTAGAPVKTVQTEIASSQEETELIETEIDWDLEQVETEKAETSLPQAEKERKVAGVPEEMEKAEIDLHQEGMARRIVGVQEVVVTEAPVEVRTVGDQEQNEMESGVRQEREKTEGVSLLGRMALKLTETAGVPAWLAWALDEVRKAQRKAAKILTKTRMRKRRKEGKDPRKTKIGKDRTRMTRRTDSARAPRRMKTRRTRRRTRMVISMGRTAKRRRRRGACLESSRNPKTPSRSWRRTRLAPALEIRLSFLCSCCLPSLLADLAVFSPSSSLL